MPEHPVLYLYPDKQAIVVLPSFVIKQEGTDLAAQISEGLRAWRDGEKSVLVVGGGAEVVFLDSEGRRL